MTSNVVSLSSPPPPPKCRCVPKPGQPSGGVDRRKTRNEPPTRRLKVTRNVLNDPKLWSQQIVCMTRLSPNVVKKYDKSLYKKFYKQFCEQKSLQKYSKLFHKFQKTRKNDTNLVVNTTAGGSANTTANGPDIGGSPRRMRLWDSGKSPTRSQVWPTVQTTYRTLRSLSHDLKQWTVADERENSLMSVSEYNRYLGLIGVKPLKQLDAKQLNTSFHLRNISKCDGYSVNESTNQLTLKPEFLINHLVNDFKPQNSDPNERKKLATKVLTANRIKDKYKKIEKHKMKIIKDWKRQYLQCMTLYPFSSPMGQRVSVSLNSHPMDTSKVESMVRKYETSCCLRIHHRDKPVINKLNVWSARNIERLTTGLELSQRSHVLASHQYSFTRRQRLDKLKRLKTGIDWKSRLLALSCKPGVDVLVDKLNVCPICGHSLVVDHSCDMSDICDTSSEAFNHKKTSNSSLRQQPMSLRDSSKRLKKTMVTKDGHQTSPKKSIQKICRIDLNEEEDNEDMIANQKCGAKVCKIDLNEDDDDD